MAWKENRQQSEENHSVLEKYQGFQKQNLGNQGQENSSSQKANQRTPGPAQNSLVENQRRKRWYYMAQETKASIKG